MANKILFKTSTSNDSTKLVPASGTSTIAKTPGTVYFTKDGKIIYDLDANTRLIMSDYVSKAKLADTATKAKQDQDGRVIDETYIASLKLSNYTLTAKNGDGTTKATINVAPTNSDGIIPLKHIPVTALERVIVVANQTARFALTTDEVQNGDVVKENDTGIMYFVSDDTNLNNASGYQEFHAGMSAWAKEADYADEAGKATNDSNGNKIAEKYIIYPFTLNTDKTKVTIKNGIGTSSTLDYNFYPTKWTWTNGTAAGPTATITMAGMDNIAVASIPAASTSISGIVTTGTQSFAGVKTFSNDVSIAKTLTVEKQVKIGNGADISTEPCDLEVAGGVDIGKNLRVTGGAVEFKQEARVVYDSTKKAFNFVFD